MSPGSVWPLAQLPGMRAEDLQRLGRWGIADTQELLAACGSEAEQNALAGQLGVSRRQVQKWAALADLARIPEVGCQNCGLLLHAGILSAADLAQTSPAKLHRQILRLQVASFQRRDRCPSVAQVQRWILQSSMFQR